MTWYGIEPLVYRNAGQCSFSSDLTKVLLVSFIIAIPIICGFMINLCGSFFFYKISIILVCIVTFIVQWVGWPLLYQLSSPKDLAKYLLQRIFTNCLLQRIFTNCPPSKDLHQLSSSKDLHQLSSSKDLHQLSPSKDLHQLSSSKDLHQLSPSKDLHQLSSSKDLHQLTLHPICISGAPKSDLDECSLPTN